MKKVKINKKKESEIFEDKKNENKKKRWYKKNKEKDLSKDIEKTTIPIEELKENLKNTKENDKENKEDRKNIEKQANIEKEIEKEKILILQGSITCGEFDIDYKIFHNGQDIDVEASFAKSGKNISTQSYKKEEENIYLLDDNSKIDMRLDFTDLNKNVLKSDIPVFGHIELINNKLNNEISINRNGEEIINLTKEGIENNRKIDMDKLVEKSKDLGFLTNVTIKGLNVAVKNKLKIIDNCIEL